MQVLFEVIANILAFLYGLIPNYAVAIILLTLLVMIATTPLTLKSTRSMLEMQRLQPEMKRLQSQYKDDRQRLNEELLKFYKENDISPLGGCLPLLVQMPVFIVLYQVLRGLTRRVSDAGFDIGWISGQLATNQQPTAAPNYPRNFDPAYVNHDTLLYQNLSNTNTMQAFGMNLAESCSEALQQGILHALPYILLIVIVGVTGFIQQRQITRRTAGQTQMSSQQQTIMKIMPIFLPVISFSLPAGLVLYFAVSNLYRIGQQYFISRSIYGVGRDDGGKAAPASAGGGSGKPSVGAGARTRALAALRGSSSSTIDTTAEEADGEEAVVAAGKANGKADGNGQRARSRPSKTKVAPEERTTRTGTSARERRTTVARPSSQDKASAGGKSKAGSSGTRTGSAKDAGTGSKAAAKSSAKATTRSGAKSSGKSGATSSAAGSGRSSGGRAQPAKSSPKPAASRSGSGGSGSAGNGSAALQPRARKKKR